MSFFASFQASSNAQSMPYQPNEDSTAADSNPPSTSMPWVIMPIAECGVLTRQHAVFNLNNMSPLFNLSPTPATGSHRAHPQSFYNEPTPTTKKKLKEYDLQLCDEHGLHPNALDDFVKLSMSEILTVCLTVPQARLYIVMASKNILNFITTNPALFKIEAEYLEEPEFVSKLGKLVKKLLVIICGNMKMKIFQSLNTTVTLKNPTGKGLPINQLTDSLLLKISS
ncbi:hypothetical protein Moror_15859 [Moniliophthora roreri MCA 2997]|uniref:Uncharacterized protein n=1 Tax=Moniliophthora roreri (strain MCA 2997) TaxID=1381753 RepID=V2XQH2_MONRO|nr:hypothetical protein Moror_15859 [Moniliophthora roreri MCA 2997]